MLGQLDDMENGCANSCCCGYCSTCCEKLTEKWEKLTEGWSMPSSGSMKGFISASSLTLASNVISFTMIALAPAEWSLYLALYNTAAFFNLAQTAKTRAVSQSFTNEFIPKLEQDLDVLGELIELKGIDTSSTKETETIALLTELKNDAHKIIAALKTAKYLNSRKELIDLLFTLGYLARLIVDIVPHTRHVSKNVDIAMTVVGGFLYAWGSKRGGQTDLYRVKAASQDASIQNVLQMGEATHADRFHDISPGAGNNELANVPHQLRPRAATLSGDDQAALTLQIQKQQAHYDEEERQQGVHSKAINEGQGNSSSTRSRIISTLQILRPDQLRAPATLSNNNSGIGVDLYKI